MKLKCMTGSISCDGELAEKGDVFEVSDEAGESLIKSGDAILQEESTPQVDEPEVEVEVEVEDEPEVEPEQPSPNTDTPEQEPESQEVVESKRFDGNITDEPEPEIEPELKKSKKNKRKT